MRAGIEVLAIFAADLHISETPPVARSCEPDWFTAMSRNLEVLVELRHQHNKVPIFYAGDIFHKWNVSPEAINFAIDYLPTGWAVPGNHDLPNHRYADKGRSAYTTLVRQGTINDMDPSKSYCFDGFTVYPFPYGHEVTPRDSSSVIRPSNIRVAVVHDYCWIDGHGYEGADPKHHASEMAKKTAGYDAVFIGDNHAAWTVPVHRGGSKFTHLFNCGCLIPRRSPERKYKPRVGLLLSNGEVREHFLDTSKDLWLDPEEAAKKVLEDDGEGVREFVDLLKRAGNRVISFEAVLRRMISDKKGSIPPKVREAILEALESVSVD